MSPKIKTLAVFACPECRRQKFESVMAVNNHLTKSHRVDYKIYLDSRGRAHPRKTSNVKVSKASLNKFL